MCDICGEQIRASTIRGSRSRGSHTSHSASGETPDRSASTSHSPALRSNNSSLLDLAGAADDNSDQDDARDDQDATAEEVNLIIENMSTPSRDRNSTVPSTVGPSNAESAEAGERVARSVATEMRLARLTRRAEEEAALNRAILMSLQDDRVTETNHSEQTEADIESLMNMGFERDVVIQALRETRNNLELAANRLFGIDN